MNDRSEVLDEFRRVSGEFSERVYLGNVQAVAFCLIDGDGDLQTSIVYLPGTRISLMGGITILSHDLMAELKSIKTKSVDPEENGDIS